MALKFGSLIVLIVSIFTLYFVICISQDTKIDTFQQPFDKGEKEILFYSPNPDPLINSLEFNLKCELYKENIMNPKVTKLGDIFNINIELIHNQVIWLIIIYILVIILLLLFFLFTIISVKKQNLYFACLSCCTILATVILAIINMILIYRFFITFYKSDISNFVEFLSCKNVKIEAFSKHFYVKDLDYHFTRFIIFGIITILLSTNSRKENNENNKQQNQNNNDIELVNN